MAIVLLHSFVTNKASLAKSGTTRVIIYIFWADLVMLSDIPKLLFMDTRTSADTKQEVTPTHENMEQQKFKVIIVGGSIAGLTLAHCLDQANIEHVVLEKRDAIAPQEGAFIGIWPNGARVFEQLGLFRDMEKQTSPFHKMHLRYPDGFSFSSSLPKLVSERLVFLYSYCQKTWCARNN